MTKKYKPADISNYEKVISENLSDFIVEWEEFVKEISIVNGIHKRTYIDKDTQKPISFFSESKWHRSHRFEQDVLNYFSDNNKIISYNLNINYINNNLKISDLQQDGMLSRENIELNYQTNKSRLNRAESLLIQVKDEVIKLKEKIDSVTSEGHKQSLMKWLIDKNNNISNLNNAIEKFKTWIKEDIEKLANISDNVE